MVARILGLCILLQGAFAPLLVGSARAEDPAERAARIRDEILARRRADDERSATLGQFEQQRDEAEARLQAIRADLQAATDRDGAVREQHARIATRLAELDAQLATLMERDRARTAAIYRAAGLGAGAAGWGSGVGARNLRLARYLVATASRSDAEVTTLEVEKGSNLETLGRTVAEEQRAAAELGRLQALRVSVETELARAESELAEASAAPVGFVSDAQDESGAGAGSTADAMEAQPMHDASPPSAQPAGAAAAAREDRQPASEGVAATSREERQAATSADRLRELARAQSSKDGAAGVQADARAASQQNSPVSASEGAGMSARESTAFDWSQPAEGGATAADGSPTLRFAEAPPTSEERRPPAAAGAQAAAQRPADSLREHEQPASRKSERNLDTHDADAAAAGQGSPAGEEAAEEESRGEKRGLLSRLFGGSDGDAKRFAAAKGSLRAPLAGRVVASFGQRHESGAVYRGIIVRGGRGASVTAVADGTVLFAGPVSGLGEVMILGHGSRYHTVYARLDALRFKVGQHVGAGEVVGRLPADDGDLDFEIREDGRAIDPLPWLRGTGGGPSR